MPYATDKQRRFMHARHPGIAKRWDREIAAGKGKKHKKKASVVLDNPVAFATALGNMAGVKRAEAPGAVKPGPVTPGAAKGPGPAAFPQSESAFSFPKGWSDMLTFNQPGTQMNNGSAAPRYDPLGLAKGIGGPPGTPPGVAKGPGVIPGAAKGPGR
jgi:hypothetical protein